MIRTSILATLALCLIAPMLAFGQADTPYGMLDPKQYTPGVDPDPRMFIGDWRESIPRDLRSGLIVRDILTVLEGEDHLRPTRKGAVLRTVKSVTRATIEPHVTTQPFANTGEQELFYIHSGKGVASSKGNTYELKEGVGLVIAPGVEYTLSNTSGSEQLVMFRVVEPIPEGFTPNTELVATYEYDHPEAMTVHWANIDRSILGKKDGTAVMGGFTAVKLDPMTMAQPHSHQEGVEEIWIALKGDITVLLGKHLFKLPVGAAYKIPENGICAHANINTSDSQIKLMHMMHVPEAAVRRLR
ncbi:MAG: cupin domain-containing protein [Candidatus Latescibacteria bacterium]|nr:cupin domain-containing protein [Candidatus Latescibacterota bacterium]